MKSTIIIPNYNGAAYLENCLRSIEGERADIIVIDNGSNDNSCYIIRECFPQVRLVCFEENRGFCAAVNEGIRLAESKYVILLNNDTEAESGFVTALERAMEADGRLFAASAKLISMHDKKLADDAGDLYCALGWAYAVGKGKPESSYNTPRRIFAACGGAAIYRRDILLRLGLFDENHFAYLEDIDIGYRAAIYGYHSAFVPSARVYHAGSASSGSRYNAFKVKLSAANSIYLIYKNMPLLQIVINFPFLLLGFFIKIIFFIKKGFGKEYVQGLMKGFQICMSGEGRSHKVYFAWSRIANYCDIQLALWVNMIKRITIR